MSNQQVASALALLALVAAAAVAVLVLVLLVLAAVVSPTASFVLLVGLTLVALWLGDSP